MCRSYACALTAVLLAVGALAHQPQACRAQAFKPTTEREKVLAELRSPTTLEFIETPLADVVDYFKDLHGIDIRLDTEAFGDAGPNGKTPITRNLKGLSLRSTLRLMLRDLALDYVVKDGFLLITTPEAAENQPYRILYPVDEIVGRGGGAGSQAIGQSLVRTMVTGVAPESWQLVGGQGTISLERGLPGWSLAIKQNSRVHDEIEDLLARLRSLAKRRTDSFTPLRGRNVEAGPAEMKILKELDSPTTLEFLETPLADVVDYLKELHKIEIQIDIRCRCLVDVGMGTDTPITRNLRGISLGRTLRLMLHDLDLTYVIQDEVLLITTPKIANTRQVTRVYPLDGLVRVRESRGSRQLDCDRLVKALKTVVAPKTWAEVGGPGAISVIPAGPARCLVVRQCDPVHEQISDVLDRLRIVVEGEVGRFAKKTICDALDSPTSLQFIETPLLDVIDHIKDLHDIEIQDCRRALYDVGLGTDLPITVNLKDVRLAEALKKILDPLKLAYVAEDELLLITTPEDANSRLFARVYALDMGTAVRIAPRDEPGDWRFERTVAPASWSRSGGSGSVALFSEGSARALVIWQTGPVHGRLVPMLGQPVLRQATPRGRKR